MGTSGARLIKYDAARTALAEAHRVDEAKDLRDKALALAAYARQAQDRDMITWATEIKLRAERRTGELLRETAQTERRQGDGRPKRSSGATVSAPAPRLKDLGVTKQQSSDWQKLAAIPEPEFERRLAHAARDPKTMTTEKILRPVPKTMAVDPFAEEREVWAGVSGWLYRVRDLPSLDRLRSVKPTGGARAALQDNLARAETYMADLMGLRTEGWI